MLARLASSNPAGPEFTAHVARPAPIRHHDGVSSSGKLLVLGFVVVLAAGVALWRFVLTGEATAQVVVAPTPSAASTPDALPATATPSVAVSPDARVQEPAVVPAPPRQPAIAEPIGAAGSEEDQVEYVDGKPVVVASIKVIRDATIATNGPLQDCIDKSGVKELTGKAMLTFIVARKREQTGEFSVAVEDTGFEEEGTTIQQPELLECMHRTALAMKFPPNKSPVAVWAKRRIEVENGVLQVNYVSEWKRVR